MGNIESIILEKLNLVIDKNLKNADYSLDDVCKEIGISRTQLHRILKEKTHLSTTLYIRKRRLEKAKGLLSTTKLRISEVADAVGINVHTNFSKYFFEEFQISPTDFRKQFQEHDNEVKATFENILPADHSFISFETSAGVTTKFSPPFRNLYVYAALAIITVLTGGFYFLSRPEKKNATQLSTDILQVTDNSIAILPFKNLGLSQKTLFSDGIMEQIHGSLSRLENLKIISKNSSLIFRNTQKPLSQIAQELHVKYILEGSVLQMENKIRINVELTNAQEDRAVWTKSYDGNTEDVFTYMSTVAKDMAVELNQKLNRGFKNKIDKIPTKSLTAYNEYLQGRELMETRDKGKLAASILKFDRAIRLDPDFADAYAERANAFYLSGDGHYIDLKKAEKMAESNALTTLRLDSDNSLAYGILANIYRNQNKWEQANTTYQIALKYNPNDALIHYWYSLMLRSLGHADEAMKYSSKAVELDPLSHVILGGHILNCTFAGRLDLAKKGIETGELLFNDSWVYYFTKAFYQIVKNDYKAALIDLNKSYTLSPSVGITNNMIVFCKGKLGQTEEVNIFLKSLADIPENYQGFIIANASLGNKEQAMYYLQKMADSGIIPTDLKVMPFYKILHNDKRYEAILQKYGLLTPDISTQTSN